MEGSTVQALRPQGNSEGRPGTLPKVRSVFISDVHLGFPGCSAEFLCDFLRQVECDVLYLVGDIIDFWYMRKKRYWHPSHSEVINLILEKVRGGTRVVFVPGNHDECLRAYDGLQMGHLSVRDRVVHETADGRQFLVLHGDQFDSVVRCSPLLAVIGSHIYDWLLRMNVVVNRVRSLFGKEYWSLAAFLKHKVKNAVQYIGRYEEAVVTAARRHGVDGVICGHIHRAEISDIGGTLYMNCGDWVESCTLLLEHHDGQMQLMEWREGSTTLKAHEPGSGVAATPTDDLDRAA